MTSKDLIIKYNQEFLNTPGDNMNCPRCGLTPLESKLKSTQLDVHIYERCAKKETIKRTMKQPIFLLKQWYAAK